jgi:hypothetical protein
MPTPPRTIVFIRRIGAWFAHYLKGEPAAKWITDGVPGNSRW